MKEKSEYFSDFSYIKNNQQNIYLSIQIGSNPHWAATEARTNMKAPKSSKKAVPESLKKNGITGVSDNILEGKELRIPSSLIMAFFEPEIKKFLLKKNNLEK